MCQLSLSITSHILQQNVEIRRVCQTSERECRHNKERLAIKQRTINIDSPGDQAARLDGRKRW